MQARVIFEVPGGAVCEVPVGGWIGRLPSAACCLDDGRISEAHALVSLRGQSLVLLPLRGRFAVEGTPRTRVDLEPGLAIDLAEGLRVVVKEVVLPETVMALEADGLPLQVLSGTTSLFAGPPVSARGGWLPEAQAWVWSHGGEWRLQLKGRPARTANDGDAVSLGALQVRFAAVPLSNASTPPTRLEGQVAAPLRIVARYQSVHLSAEGRERLVLDGVAAALVSELVHFNGPVGWQVAAQELWRGITDPVVLRGRWDMALVRARSRLRAAGIRPDLIRSDGHGFVELALRPGDVVVDET